MTDLNPAAPKKGPAIILLVIGGALILLLGLALVAMFLVSGTSGPRPFSGGEVAVIPIMGEIQSHTDSFSNSFSSREIKDYLKQADEDSGVAAILLEIDSPGGGVVPSKEIAQAVASTKKPVVAYIENVGASGGYYAASASDYIVADEDSITGSIGVIAIIPSIESLLKEHGVNVQVLKKGTYKAAGNPFEDLSPADANMYQGMLDQAYAHFKRDILQYRPYLTAQRLDAVADGRILTGEQALAAGLIDQTGSYDDAVKKAGDLAGIENPNAVLYAQKSHSLLDFFTGAGYNLGQGFQKGLTAGVSENVPQVKT